VDHFRRHTGAGLEDALNAGKSRSTEYQPTLAMHVARVGY
jgi:hypothetical protein